MTRNEVMDVLMDCVAQIYKADKCELSENTNLPETFGTNSLNRVALCSMIENEIDVLISLGDVGKYPTIGELTDFVIENMDE